MSAASLRRHALGLFLGIVVAAWWTVMTATVISDIKPSYGGAKEHLLKVTWSNALTWTDYGAYQRYSPLGFVAAHFLDRKLFGPLAGVAPADPSESAPQLVPLFCAALGVLTYVAFLVFLRLGLAPSAAVIGAVALGMQKDFSYYFHFVSCFATIVLMVFALGFAASLRSYLVDKKRFAAVAVFLWFALALGAWEQALNLLPALALVALAACLAKRTIRPAVDLAVAPVFLGLVFVAWRMKLGAAEATGVSEAQLVTAYGRISPMMDDLLLNFSLHVSNVVGSYLVPWPQRSFASMAGLDMVQLNAYNATYARVPDLAYQGMGLLYAGALTVIATGVSLLLVRSWWRRRSDGIPPYLFGLAFAWCGFLVHLPIMHRTYFLLPGFNLGYKQAISVVGLSLLVGNGSQWILGRLGTQTARTAFVVCAPLALAACAFAKIYWNHNY